MIPSEYPKSTFVLDVMDSNPLYRSIFDLACDEFLASINDRDSAAQIDTCHAQTIADNAGKYFMQAYYSILNKRKFAFFKYEISPRESHWTVDVTCETVEGFVKVRLAKFKIIKYAFRRPIYQIPVLVNRQILGAISKSLIGSEMRLDCIVFPGKRGGEERVMLDHYKVNENPPVVVDLNKLVDGIATLFLK